MNLISLLVTLIVIGLLLYLVDLLPIEGNFKLIIRIVLIIILILWILQNFLGGPGLDLRLR